MLCRWRTFATPMSAFAFTAASRIVPAGIDNVCMDNVPMYR